MKEANTNLTPRPSNTIYINGDDSGLLTCGRLVQVFSTCGLIKDVRIQLVGKPCAFVEFLEEESVERALKRKDELGVRISHAEVSACTPSSIRVLNEGQEYNFHISLNKIKEKIKHRILEAERGDAPIEGPAVPEHIRKRRKDSGYECPKKLRKT